MRYLNVLIFVCLCDRLHECGHTFREKLGEFFSVKYTFLFQIGNQRPIFRGHAQAPLDHCVCKAVSGLNLSIIHSFPPLQRIDPCYEYIKSESKAEE